MSDDNNNTNAENNMDTPPEPQTANTSGPASDQPKDVGVEELAKAHQGAHQDSQNATKESGAPDLGLLLDIPVTLSLELGSTRINLGDLLRLNKGAIVELEKEASEPLEVKVNGTLIAYADVVLVNDRYGIRMIDVISESERIKKFS